MSAAHQELRVINKVFPYPWPLCPVLRCIVNSHIAEINPHWRSLSTLLHLLTWMGWDGRGGVWKGARSKLTDSSGGQCRFTCESSLTQVCARVSVGMAGCVRVSFVSLSMKVNAMYKGLCELFVCMPVSESMPVWE